MIVAALDLGTNTFILLVARVQGGRIEEVLHDEVRVVRLGQGVHQDRRFHPDALARADECLGDYAATIERFGATQVLACATSAARDVSNGAELSAIATAHGIPLEIISGEREAELTFEGAVSGDEAGSIMIIDVGGGSTEFILGDAAGIRERQSLDLGSVRLTEMFVTSHPIPPDELKRMFLYIEERVRALAKTFEPPPSTKIVAVAGTPTTLATIELGSSFDAARVHGFKLPCSRIQTRVEELARMSVAQRQALAGMEPKRADVIVAGALILQIACQVFKAAEMEVSIRGLRYGIAMELSR